MNGDRAETERVVAGALRMMPNAMSPSRAEILTIKIVAALDEANLLAPTISADASADDPVTARMARVLADGDEPGINERTMARLLHFVLLRANLLAPHLAAHAHPRRLRGESAGCERHLRHCPHPIFRHARRRRSVDPLAASPRPSERGNTMSDECGICSCCGEGGELLSPIDGKGPLVCQWCEADYERDHGDLTYEEWAET